MSQAYANYYRESLERAIEFQDYVYSLLYEIGIVVVQYQSRKFQFERGENSGGIEIKFDDRLDQRWLHEKKAFAEKQTPTSKGFVLLETLARRYAALTLTCDKKS